MDAAKTAAILVADGSEVSTLVEGAQLLAEEGISVRVVNVPSEGLFATSRARIRIRYCPQGFRVTE